MAADDDETITAALTGAQMGSCAAPDALSQGEIEDGLKQLGLARGDIVEVHSSLSSFGWVEGGAATVVNALMEVVGEEGAIVMSAYPVSKPLPLTDQEKERGITAKVRLFGEDYDGPSGMGAIADEFRHRPATVLGPGFHRVCAWGHNAQLLSRGYQHLLEADGWVLLLGVGIGYVSSMHQAEKVGIPPEVVECVRVPDEIRRDYPVRDVGLAQLSREVLHMDRRCSNSHGAPGSGPSAPRVAVPERRASIAETHPPPGNSRRSGRHSGLCRHLSLSLAVLGVATPGRH